MNKINKLIQCIRTRRHILGKIGKGNVFRPQVLITSAAVIGNNNYFSDRAMVGNAVIGNYCSIAPDAKIAQSQHAVSYITTYQKICAHNINYSMNNKPAMIGNDVWIGANAVIMQGVCVGNGAVIGANAVVTHDLPPFSIAVGMPAKVIKYRFDKDVCEIIEKSNWWENTNLEDAQKAVKELEDLIKIDICQGGNRDESV